MSDINCALALSQIKKLKKIILKRKKIALRYQKNLKKVEKHVKILNIDKINYSAWHLLILKFNFKNTNLDLNQIHKRLKKNLIITQQHYNPTYKFKFFRKQKNFIKVLENADIYNLSCLSFPIYFTLTLKNVDYICQKIINLFDNQD